MELVLGFFIGTLISWVSLMVIIPVAQSIASFSMPLMGERAWKLAVVAAAGNGIAVALDPVHFLLSWLVGFVVFWVFMVKWFDVDFLGALVIIVVTWAFRLLILGPVLIALLSALQ